MREDDAVRVPQQMRSRESLERVLAAGIELLRLEGYAGLSIAEVCKRADVSVGSIYARFKSKEALFQALHVRMLEIIDQEQASLFEGLAPATAGTDRSVVETAVERVADHVDRHQALLRVMILRGAVDADTRARGSASSLQLADRFETFLLDNVAAFGVDDPALAVDIAFRILYATLTRRLVSGPTFESRRILEWDAFVAEIGRALSSYLLGSTPVRPSAPRRRKAKKS